MTFISYAQNFEDVMLWRALKHIKDGFYIDVGAWSPDFDSVTRAFYERGWTGINIEPNPEYHRKLQERRPRDLNLQVAVSDHQGALTMNFLDESGLSTLDGEIASQHQNAGYRLDHQEDIQVTTLASLWHQYVPVGQNVHFLKVDVEGLEEQVLQGNDWTINRPWVVVIEATWPNTQVESHEYWESLLLAVNYTFAYADGLNRFYVASEQVELLTAFKYPPNFFDEFVLSRVPQLEAEKDQLVAQLEASEADRAARLDIIEAQGQQLGWISQLEADKEHLIAQLEASEADRAARLDIIEAQGQQLGRISQLEADKDYLIAQLQAREVEKNQLVAHIQASEAERAKIHENWLVKIGIKAGLVSIKNQ